MYKKFYNLTQNPFLLTANPAFFFDSAGHKRAKAYLRYGLKQGEGFVVVIGAAGTGKTMLIKDLYQSLKQDHSIIIGLMITSQLDAEDTLRMLAATFKITYKETDNKATLLSRLEDFFIENARLGKRILLIVDEAQNLPEESIEELRMLSNHEFDGKSIFQIFLLGQEELGHLLASSEMDQVKQRIVATYYLKELKPVEVKQYIEFRLLKSGWKNNPEFRAEIFAEIYKYTQGIPRRINTLCDRLLLYGYLEELTEINLENIEHVISEIEEDFKSLGSSEGKTKKTSVRPVIVENNKISEKALKSLKINQVTIETEIEQTKNLTQEQRIELLEKKLTELTTVFNKEQELLRKAILIQLDIGDIISED
jgi:putative secretion ATPase (PEP-CTERM system associated)